MVFITLFSKIIVDTMTYIWMHNSCDHKDTDVSLSQRCFNNLLIVIQKKSSSTILLSYINNVQKMFSTSELTATEAQDRPIKKKSICSNGRTSPLT